MKEPKEAENRELDFPIPDIKEPEPEVEVVFSPEEEKMKEKLLSIGGLLWCKHGKRRVYFPDDILYKLYGLSYRTYNSGAVSYAEVDGEKIANHRATHIILSLSDSKFHYDFDKKDFFFKAYDERHCKYVVEKIKELLEVK